MTADNLTFQKENTVFQIFASGLRKNIGSKQCAQTNLIVILNKIYFNKILIWLVIYEKKLISRFKQFKGRTLKKGILDEGQSVLYPLFFRKMKYLKK